MVLDRWTFIDKATWKEGPWKQEPDRIEWIDTSTGLFCLILRKPSGALSGYVGVPSGHPFFLSPHHLLGLWVHRGLSYSNVSRGHEATGIRFTSDSETTGSIWWFGFSCDYEDDLCPARSAPRGYYRDIEYVTQEISSLIAQIKQRSSKRQAASTQLKIEQTVAFV